MPDSVCSPFESFHIMTTHKPLSFSSMITQNYGAFFDTLGAGIDDAVLIDGKNGGSRSLSSQTWVYQVSYFGVTTVLHVIFLIYISFGGKIHLLVIKNARSLQCPMCGGDTKRARCRERLKHPLA